MSMRIHPDLVPLIQNPPISNQQVVLPTRFKTISACSTLAWLTIRGGLSSFLPRPIACMGGSALALTGAITLRLPDSRQKVAECGLAVFATMMGSYVIAQIPVDPVIASLICWPLDILGAITIHYFTNERVGPPPAPESEEETLI